MKVHVYHENCVLSGQQVCNRILEEYDGDPDEAGDWHCYEGTPEELLELADIIEKNARNGGGGQYDRRVADALRGAAYWERPDLEPVEWEEEE